MSTPGGLDELDDCTAGRAEGFVVDDRAVDIGKAAQRIKVVLRVVIERCFFAQPSIRQVRVGINLHVVRVVVDTVRSSDCHSA
jgi:hypothetical protein